jgi:phosphatidylglycerol:prolipoprotein diacylglycerol transferase
MHPTLFTIGKLIIPTYTVLLDLGIILGLVLTYLEGKRLLGSGDTGLDLGLWVVISGILGGRIGYVLANWSAFSENWGRALRIWEGGLSFHGAFLGGLAVLGMSALLRRKSEKPVPFWELGDVMTLGLSLGIAFGWAACLMGGCAYGALGKGFGYAVLPDIFGVQAPRFATQVVGLAYSLVLFAGFWLLRGRWPFPGASFLMFLLLYFGGQFFLEFARGDEAIYLGPWRLAQGLDLALALLAAVGLVGLWWQARGAEEQGGEEAEEEEEEEEAEGIEGTEGDEEAVEISAEDGVPDPAAEMPAEDGVPDPTGDSETHAD